MMTGDWLVRDFHRRGDVANDIIFFVFIGDLDSLHLEN